MAKAKTIGADTAKNFTLVNKFLGYRNREDKTILAPGWMIDTSQNVLIDITGRLKGRKGYSLYGAANANPYKIYAWHDWEEHLNSVINLRAWEGVLQFDYGGTWMTLGTGFGTSHIRFTNYWDNTEKINVLLFVDGTSNVYEWNGATATVDSVTTNTIKLQGANTWGQLGFYASGNKKIMIRGIEYTYTGGESTTTLTGVTPDPTAQGADTPVITDLIFQSYITTANSGITSMLSTFTNDGIANLDNQIYYGSLKSNSIYVSAINNYKSVAFTSPLRLTGEGALINLRSSWVGFAPQEDAMYICAGKSQWYFTKKTYDSTNAKEAFDIKPLKIGPKTGAINQESISHDRDSLVFISNESRLLTLGRTLNIYGTPMMTEYSYPIANDFDKYDFTDASVFYSKSFVYIAVPKESKWLILNQTDPKNIFWEAPQTGAFAGFSLINDELYAHGYSTPETYKLFDGYTDNGHAIQYRAKFAYYDYGNRGQSKYFNEFWLDGYISYNTVLNIIYNLDLDGGATKITKTLYGNSPVVMPAGSDASLGKEPLGKHGLGTPETATVADPLPTYFQVIKQSIRKDFYKFSPQFESLGANFHWEIIAFGPLVSETAYNNLSLKES
jgi:hypothetical protein